MADQDEDWKKFLDSTEEDPEEVETEDDSEDETEEDDPKDKKPAKKSDKDEDDNPDDEEDSEEEDDSDEEDAAKADDYKPRLKQFLNKDGSLNAKKIEDAYVESGKQAVELNKKYEDLSGRFDQLLGAIKAKPDIAKTLFGEEGAKKLANDTSIETSGSGGGGGNQEPANPLLQHLDAQLKNASKREYNEFVEAHPEAVTDPEKARKIGEFLKVHGEVYRRENNGEIPSMKESLEAAYRYHGWDLEIEGKEDVATAAKKAAATRTTPRGGKSKASKSEIQKGEQFFANKLGVKLRA